MKMRKYRRMNEEEQKLTGYPTDSECMRDGVSPIELVLGYDPFLIYEDIEVESVEKPPPNLEKNAKGAPACAQENMDSE